MNVSFIGSFDFSAIGHGAPRPLEDSVEMLGDGGNKPRKSDIRRC